MINNVRNPQTGTPSSGFKIYTKYNTDYIDYGDTLKVTCDTPNDITNVLSKRYNQYTSQST